MHRFGDHDRQAQTVPEGLQVYLQQGDYRSGRVSLRENEFVALARFF
jgi:hypothetical protein